MQRQWFHFSWNLLPGTMGFADSTAIHLFSSSRCRANRDQLKRQRETIFLFTDHSLYLSSDYLFQHDKWL
jgi:hypothetical protein